MVGNGYSSKTYASIFKLAYGYKKVVRNFSLYIYITRGTYVVTNRYASRE